MFPFIKAAFEAKIRFLNKKYGIFNINKKKSGQKYEEITFVVGKILTQYNILVFVTKETTNI